MDGNANEGFHAPKILGDIFESLAGAIFLDSGLDLVKVWKVFYPIMQPLIGKLFIQDAFTAPSIAIYNHFVVVVVVVFVVVVVVVVVDVVVVYLFYIDLLTYASLQYTFKL